MLLEDTITAHPRTRHGHTSRIFVSIAPAAERERTLTALSRFSSFEVTTIKGLDFAPTVGALRTDYLIVWFEEFQKLLETDANALVRVSRHARVIVALTSDQLLKAANTLLLADAWLLTDLMLEQIGMLVGLSSYGYTILPAGVGSDFGLDGLRLQLMHRLDPEERLVLEQLGVGHSNLGISKRLDFSVTRTKAIVRSILRKLHFRNRTHAAVFMARHGCPEVRANSLGVNDDDSTLQPILNRA